jgi:hypothetical protein
VPESETGADRTETCILFEVLTAAIIHAVVFLLIKLNVLVDRGSMFLRNIGNHLPDTWSHKPGHQRYMHFAATEF